MKTEDQCHRIHGLGGKNEKNKNSNHQNKKMKIKFKNINHYLIVRVLTINKVIESNNKNR